MLGKKKPLHLCNLNLFVLNYLKIVASLYRSVDFSLSFIQEATKVTVRYNSKLMYFVNI